MNFNKLLFNRVNQVILDSLVFAVSFLAGFLVRFEGFPSFYPFYKLIVVCPYFVLARLLCFYVARVYTISWRYFSIVDALRVVQAALPVSLALLLGRLFIPGEISILKWPYGVITIEFLLVVLGTLGTRMTRRMFHEASQRARYGGAATGANGRNVLLIGAGDAGNMVAKELINRKDLGYQIVGFIDDDPRKFGKSIQGIKVLGSTARLPDIVQKHRVQEAIITIANAGAKDIRRIVDVCRAVNLKAKIIPGLYEMLDEKVKITKIRQVDINDLLGRSLVKFDNQLPDVLEKYRNKRIMVTGAGGSIGSELCRQLVLLWPKELIMIDKDENSIYEIDTELASRKSGVKATPIIANIKNPTRMRSLFDQFRPEVVFHAAAHKHVPLMELNVCEAILNNIGGTKLLAELGSSAGVERFINISTDKAINPTSVMGSTKRIGEMLIQKLAAQSRTRFSCVRFGNVIGSRGSVVPLFQRQIADGGPITVTHPDIKRYFMSISEAVQLIIQAGTLGDKGEIFVLDMGKPIKILDLAKDLIRLSGYSESDIEVKFVGLRPGEKLYEETLVDEEKDQATQFRKIFVAPPTGKTPPNFDELVSALFTAAEQDDEEKIISILKEMDFGYNGEARPH